MYVGRKKRSETHGIAPSIANTHSADFVIFAQTERLIQSTKG
jgi:hypothetical protein